MGYYVCKDWGPATALVQIKSPYSLFAFIKVLNLVCFSYHFIDEIMGSMKLVTTRMNTTKYCTDI